ncbi:MAG: hypothetical protein FD138_4316, partial [Planctomycetota bacterium]
MPIRGQSGDGLCEVNCRAAADRDDTVAVANTEAHQLLDRRIDIDHFRFACLRGESFGTH